METRMEKKFWKLMNNAVYGKTIENLRNRVDVRLVNNEKDYLKWTLKQRFLTQKTFNNNLVAIRKIKATLTLNKPTYIGMCILDISKAPMYESIMIISKTDMATKQGYYLQILTA